MITIKRIEELARHRLVPAWAIKLVQDCVEDELEVCANICEEFQDKPAGMLMADLIRERKIK